MDENCTNIDLNYGGNLIMINKSDTMSDILSLYFDGRYVEMREEYKLSDVSSLDLADCLLTADFHVETVNHFLTQLKR